jgi:hypothetical protein
MLRLEGWDINWVEMKYIKHPESALVDLFYIVNIPQD